MNKKLFDQLTSNAGPTAFDANGETYIGKIFKYEVLEEIPHEDLVSRLAICAKILSGQLTIQENY